MNKDTERRPQRDQVNYILILGAGYVLYTAANLFIRLFNGETENPAINLFGGGFFALAGVWLLWHEWKVYRYAQKHRDDPAELSEQRESGGEE